MGAVFRNMNQKHQLYSISIPQMRREIKNRDAENRLFYTKFSISSHCGRKSVRAGKSGNGGKGGFGGRTAESPATCRSGVGLILAAGLTQRNGTGAEALHCKRAENNGGVKTHLRFRLASVPAGKRRRLAAERTGKQRDRGKNGKARIRHAGYRPACLRGC